MSDGVSIRQGDGVGALPEPADPDSARRTVAGEIGRAPERAAAARAWLPLLVKSPGSNPPFLAVDGRGHVFVHDRGRRRRVEHTLLAAALEAALGPARRFSRRRIDSWPEGAPVEVLEGPEGELVVVLGGRRYSVLGLPLPHPVRRRVLDRIPEGEVLDLRHTLVPRSELEAAEQRARFLAESASLAGIRRRARERLAARGVMGVAADVVRYVRDDLRRWLGRWVR